MASILVVHLLARDCRPPAQVRSSESAHESRNYECFFFFLFFLYVVCRVLYLMLSIVGGLRG